MSLEFRMNDSSHTNIKRRDNRIDLGQKKVAGVRQALGALADGIGNQPAFLAHTDRYDRIWIGERILKISQLVPCKKSVGREAVHQVEKRIHIPGVRRV